jgi:type III secretion protein Q
VPVAALHFSSYPFAHLRRVGARDAAIESTLARWLAARPLGARTARLAGGPVTARLVGVRDGACASALDPHAALAEVRVGGMSILVAASSRPVRALAQRLLGGPAELDAPRPLTTAEHAIWALALAAAIEDTGLAAEVWPCLDAEQATALPVRAELVVDVAGTPMTVVAYCPLEIVVRAPPPRAVPGWSFDLPVVAGACVLDRETLSALAVRDVVTIEPRLALVIGGGSVALRAASMAVEAEVISGYVPRSMSTIADDAHLELTVQLGTTRLSLRQLAELAPGQVIALGRPLAGPFEIHAGGTRVGSGELVDVDGEVGVRIVSLQE